MLNCFKQFVLYYFHDNYRFYRESFVPFPPVGNVHLQSKCQQNGHENDEEMHYNYGNGNVDIYIDEFTN